MMQSAESILRKDASRGCGANSVVRGSLPQPEMRAVFVVVANVFREQTVQMAFVHCNDVVENVSSAAFNPTLRHAVLPRAFEGGSDRPHLHGSNSYGNLKSVLPIPVKNQKPGSRLEWKRLPQLLDGPQARRMLCDVEMQDTSPTVADDEEAIEHAEGDSWNREEVHGRNRFPVVSKEGEPPFG